MPHDAYYVRLLAKSARRLLSDASTDVLRALQRVDRWHRADPERAAQFETIRAEIEALQEKLRKLE